MKSSKSTSQQKCRIKKTAKENIPTKKNKQYLQILDSNMLKKIFEKKVNSSK